MALNSIAVTATTFKDVLTAQGFETLVTSRMATLTDHMIRGVQVVVTDKQRRVGRELDIIIGYEAPGYVTLTSPYELVTFTGRTASEVETAAEDYRAANPGYWFAPPLYQFLNEVKPSIDPHVILQFYSQDPNGGLNWDLSGGTSATAAAAAPNQSVQFNSGGLFGGSANFLYDATTATGGVTIGNTTQSISTITGSIKTAGGLGVAKNAYIGGLTRITDTTASITAGTGALVVSGGVGIIGAVNLGANLTAQASSAGLILANRLHAISDSGDGNASIRSERTASGFAGYIQSFHASGRHGWELDGNVSVGVTSGGDLFLGTSSDNVGNGVTIDGTTGDAVFQGNLQLGGLFNGSLQLVTANVTLSQDKRYVKITTSGVTVDLWATPTDGDSIKIRNTSGGNATLDGNTNTIEGAATLVLADGESVELVWDNTNTDWTVY